MSQSAEATRRIAELLTELERQCSLLEEQLVALAWPQLTATLADQQRTLAELTNLVYSSKDARTPEFNAKVKRRIARIDAVRNDQLKRLVAFRDNCRARLTMIAKAKQARRSIYGQTAQQSRGLGRLNLYR